ncbi:MAG: metal ABC transporter ATP-binding protein [Chloroflexota bacterium]
MMSEETVKQTPVIGLRGVWAGYDNDLVLEDINFNVRKGDFIGLIGPNGGGKTTLIRVILGLIKPHRGEVRVLGETPQVGRRYIGYIPQLQDTDYDFPASVLDVVRMGRLGKETLLKGFTARDNAIVEEKLHWLGMLDLKKQAMGELSGGQRQRVYIARALATEPKILLLDEPTASVDVEASTNLYELLASLNEHVTILLISHDMNVVSKYVKTIGCLNRHLIYHAEKRITPEMLAEGYGCPVDLIAHGVPQRVLAGHDQGEAKHD